jgi:hypothetical protein
MSSCLGVIEWMASGSFEVQPEMHEELNHQLRAAYLRNHTSAL